MCVFKTRGRAEKLPVCESKTSPRAKTTAEEKALYYCQRPAGGPDEGGIKSMRAEYKPRLYTQKAFHKIGNKVDMPQEFWEFVSWNDEAKLGQSGTMDHQCLFVM